MSLFKRAGLAILILLLARSTPSLFAAATPDPKATDEKPKELPFRCSAWCSFRELRYDAPEPATLKKDDPTVMENTRPESVHWSGFGRRGQWATFVVELKNTTEKLTYKGTCSINLNPLKKGDYGDPYTTSYRQDFEVGPQTEKQYTFSVLCPEDVFAGNIPIEISASNGFRATRYINLIDLIDSDFVVVVSESSGSFRYLVPKPKNFNSNGGSDTEDDDQQAVRRHVAVVEPSELPTRWHDLMLANLIILDGPPREQLSDAQWDALKSYVKAGGHLLITAGKDPSRLKGPVEDIAGITVRDMQEISSIDEINPAYSPNRSDWKLPLVDVTVSPKGNPDVKHNKSTHFVEMAIRFYASGSVTFLPFSLSEKILMSWPGRTVVPLRILKNNSERTLFSHEQSNEDKQPPTYYPYGGIQISADTKVSSSDLNGFRHNLDESFSKDTPVKMQSRPTVLAFLLFYLLCAVPGNYLLFGWFRRREVAWLAVPLWAGTFCFLAYGVGYMGQTGELTVNEVSVIESGPGQDVGIAHTYMGLYAPRRNDYSIVFPTKQQAAAGHLINTANNEARNLDTPELYMVDSDAGLSIERLQVKQRSTRRLEIIHKVQLGSGGLEVKFRPSPSFELEVQNNTGYKLFNPVLLYQHQAIALADETEVIEPGASFKAASQSPNWIDSDKAFFGNLSFGTAHGKHASNRVQYLLDYLRNKTDAYTGGVVCAWIDGALLPVAVGPEGYKPEKPGHLEGLSLLLTPIPVRRAGTTYVIGSLNLRSCTDYNMNTGKGTWRTLASRTAQMASATDNSGAYSCETFLELQLPENAEALHQDGEQLHLNFSVAPGKTGNNSSIQFNGEVAVAVRKNQGGGRWGWVELTEALPGSLFNGINSGNAWRFSGLDFSLADPLVRSMSRTIIVRVQVRNVQYQYANSGLNPWNGGNGAAPLELRGASLRLTDRNLNPGK